MGNQVVVQLPLSDKTDFDSLIEIEDGLGQLLHKDRGVRVERHDIGQGRFNVFIVSDESWPSVVGRIRAFLEFRGVLAGAIIATRPGDDSEYTVVWPTDRTVAFKL